MTGRTIVWQTILPYLFTLMLIYLAGVFVSPLFTFVYLFLLALPLFSLVQLGITLLAMRSYQHFDTEHPTKGESISYRLSLSNESWIASSVVRVHFKPVNDELAARLQDVALTFAGNGQLAKQYTISCPFRGIYTVGLESLIVQDLLGWLRIRREAYHRTFYVFPRVIELEPPFAGSGGAGSSAQIAVGTESDASLFEGLTGYREGLPVRHVAWRKFLATGVPFLKVYGRSSQPGITLYLDLRRDGPATTRTLEAEDCSVEIAVSLVKYYLDHEVPLTLKAMGHELYTFRGIEASSFGAFHRDTVNLLFGAHPSPLSLYVEDRKGMAAGGTALFITHRADSELLDLVATEGSEQVAGIVNVTSFTPAERARYEKYFASVRERGGRLVLVSGPESIRADIAGWSG